MVIENLFVKLCGLIRILSAVPPGYSLGDKNVEQNHQDLQGGGIGTLGVPSSLSWTKDYKSTWRECKERGRGTGECRRWACARQVMIGSWFGSSCGK